MKPTITSTSVMADQYAYLMQEQAELAKLIKAHKQKMLATGLDTFEGASCRVTISKQTGRTSFDSKAAKEMLEKAGWPVPMKPLADSIRFNVAARVADTAVSAA